MSAVKLDQPLPAELLRHMSRGVAAYKNYPTFCWPWLRRRTTLFALAAAALGLLIGIALWYQTSRLAMTLQVVAYFMVGALAISSCGPLLATLVRHRRLPLRSERRLVLLALLLGLVGSFAADTVLSDAIEQTMGHPPTPPASQAAGLAVVVNALVLAFIYSLLGGGLALSSYLSEPRRIGELAREQELAELRARNQALDARLAMLQAQIEPHFLFNALASVRSMVATNPEGAVASIEALVDYLRATIPRLRENTLDSTLGQQLEICESYLKLMSARMGRLHYNVDAERTLRDVSFPPLLLVSLVENALKHGIEPKPGTGHIEIAARSDGGSLVVSVRDDGVGLREVMGDGVGLQNVREHLRARYGERAHVGLAGSAAGGAIATITIEAVGEPA